MKNLIAILFLFVSTLSIAQQTKSKPEHEKKLIQFSGVVVSSDSLFPVPYTSVMIKGSKHGTVSDYYGFFSFVAQENDVIEFAAIGFKPNRFIIPDSLPETKYSIIQVMNTDTVYLQEAVIFPWPSKEQFKNAFLNLQVPNDDVARAQRNLQAIRNPEWYSGAGMADASFNQNLMQKQSNTRVYGNNQIPVLNLMNPFAWAKFIDDWRSGKLKRQ